MSHQTAFTRFTDLLGKLARVPKHEIDAEERRAKRNKARRKHPKPAKPGQIATPPEPAR